MFGRKSNTGDPPPKRKGGALMQQMGYGNMGDLENDMYGDLDNDEELEAELLALQGEAPDNTRNKGKKKAVGLHEIDRMAAECMRDIGSDEDMSDTDDPDLLSELEGLSGDEAPSPTPPPSGAQVPKVSTSGVDMVAMVEDRMALYQLALDNAKSSGDVSKQRRLDRGFKNLQDLHKKAKAGKAVSEDDLPPPVAIGRSSPQPEVPNQADSSAGQAMMPTIEPTITPKAPSPVPSTQVSQPPSQTTSDPRREILKTRRDQYKTAALKAKSNGDRDTAVKMVRVAKQFDSVISALDEGKPIDLSKMPPPPPGFAGTHEDKIASEPTPKVTVQEAQLQRGGDEDQTPSEAAPQLSKTEEKAFFKAPDAPSTIMEALEQRLEKYKSAETAAKEAGESSKARRHGRIVKQYQDAIKATKAGKPVDYEELPTPPGFAPIPIGNSGGQSSQPQAATAATMAASASSERLAPPSGGNQGPSPQKKMSRTPSPHRAEQPKPAPVKQTPPQRQISGSSIKKSPTSRAEQQAVFLTERMEEYKKAALNAKRNNDIELAKKYIRIAKGFEPMIDASESGLPVDMSQIPPSLTENDEPSFAMVKEEDVVLSGDRTEVFKKLEQDLINQIRLSATNHQHYTKLGDVLNAAKFEKLEQGCRKDLDALKNAFKHKDPVPKFHYENRTFSIVRCNTDLGDNDLELTLVRGIQLPTGHAEKDLDTYVKFEFPYPNEEPQTGSSETVKGSVNPEYNEPWKLQISRKSRGFARVVERKAVKLEVYYKRGLFKSDKLIGTSNVKLSPLDSQCTVHDSYDLVEGRKTVGGKLEVKMRIRDPLKGKQVENTKEKWLVIDQFLKTLVASKAPAPTGPAKSPTGSTCIEVLRFEKQKLDEQIHSLRDRLSTDQTKALLNKSQLIKQRMEEQQAWLKQGGVQALKAYVAQVDKEIKYFEDEARHLAKGGDMAKAEIVLYKIKQAQKELSAIRTKFPNL